MTTQARNNKNLPVLKDEGHWITRSAKSADGSSRVASVYNMDVIFDPDQNDRDKPFHIVNNLPDGSTQILTVSKYSKSAGTDVVKRLVFKTVEAAFKAALRSPHRR